MTDEQFRALQTLIKAQTVEIAALALAIRTLERRLVSVEAKLTHDIDSDVFETSELDRLLKTR